MLKDRYPAVDKTICAYPVRRFGAAGHSLHAAAGSRSSAGLPGRDLKAVPRRDAGADPNEGGAPGPLRLRIRAKWDRQPLLAVRAARRLAPRQSHRSPHRVDYAHVLKDLADVHFSAAQIIV